MDTLINYLNTMFRSLPDTPEARRAKDELRQMMEDKYADLISEGKSENEAVGTVITELGNLDEFADQLGIRSLVPVRGAAGSRSGGPEADSPQYDFSADDAARTESGPRYGYTMTPCRILDTEEADSYLKAMTRVSLVRAAGIALCIISMCGHTFFGEIADHIPVFKSLFELLRSVFFFGSILLGVLLIIRAGHLEDPWKYVLKERCILDPKALLFVSERNRSVRAGIPQLRTVGILLCAACWVPAAILDSLNNFFLSEIVPPTLLFLFVGAGVAVLVLTGGMEDAPKKLLKRDRALKAEA